MLQPPNQFYREDYQTSHRHFTTEGYDYLSTLLPGIRNGDQEAIASFVKAIQPWIERTKRKTMQQPTSTSKPADELQVDSAINAALFDALEIIKKENFQQWHQVQTVLAQKISSHLSSIQKEENDPNEQPLSKAIQRTLKAPPARDITESTLEEVVDSTLKELPPREGAIIRQTIMEGRTPSDVKKDHDVSNTRIGQLRDRGIRRLKRRLTIIKQFEDYLPGVHKDEKAPVSRIPREPVINEDMLARLLHPYHFENERRPVGYMPGILEKWPQKNLPIELKLPLIRHASIDELRQIAQSYFVDATGKSLDISSDRRFASDHRYDTNALTLALDRNRPADTVNSNDIYPNHLYLQQLADRFAPESKVGFTEHYLFREMMRELFTKVKESAQPDSKRSEPVRGR